MLLNPNAPLLMPDVTNQNLAAMAELAALTLPYYVEETPVVEFTRMMNDGSLQTVYVKDETRQPGHSFKDRGAAYAVEIYAELGVTSVLTASAGNHGLGLARAARHYGLEATVVVPRNTEEVKKTKIAELGAKLVEYDGDFSECEDHALLLAGQSDAQYVAPFANPYVAAGQGTIAVELLKQLPGVTRFYAPVGGTGLLAGTGSVIKRDKPETLVISAQPDGANAFTQSVDANRVVNLETVDARFGGLAVRNLDPATFELARRVTDYCAQVSPNEVFRAVHDYREATGVLLEPAGAVGLAASLAVRASCSPNEVVATVLTGSNASAEIGDYIDRLAEEYGWNIT